MDSNGVSTSFLVRKTQGMAKGTSCFGSYLKGDTLDIINSDYNAVWVQISLSCKAICRLLHYFSHIHDCTLDKTP